MNKDNPIKVLLDTVKYISKPKEEIGLISNRLTDHLTEIAIEELAKQVTSPNGKSWCPATFKGNRNNDSWLSQQLFALDFDKGMAFEDVLSRLQHYGLDCTFAYETFSNTPERPKFRVIFQLNQVITNLVDRNSIQLALMTLFPPPETDKSCKDPARMYFGGKALIYENYDYYLNLPLLIDAVRCWSVRNSTPNNVNRDLKRLDKKWIKSGNSYIYNIEHSIFNPKKQQQHTNLLKLDFGKLRKKVKILDDFMNGEWLYHNMLFGLATNLRHIHGGASLFKECLDKNSNYTRDKYNLASVAKYYNYHPMNLKNFSPYPEDCIYKNLLQAYQQDIVRIEPYQAMTLKEAELKFKDKFKLALESDNNDIYVFKVATGLGKTEAFLNLEQVTIALPNHDLKDEVESRFKGRCQITPSLPSELSDEVKNKLNYYYSIGALSEANRYLAKEAKTNKILEYYLKKTLSCYSSTQTVLTTHQKALFVDFDKHNTLIFDEDPISSINCFIITSNVM